MSHNIFFPDTDNTTTKNRNRFHEKKPLFSFSINLSNTGNVSSLMSRFLFWKLLKKK